MEVLKLSDLKVGSRFEVDSENGATYEVMVAAGGRFLIRGGEGLFKEPTLCDILGAERGQGENGVLVSGEVRSEMALAISDNRAPKGQHVQIPKILKIRTL